MGSVRGRALLDLARHRLGWTARGGFDTKEFWERSYAKAVLPHEWALPPSSLLKYEFRDVSMHRTTTTARATATLDQDCPRAAKTLVLGGGTSTLGQTLIDNGWNDVTALDFSEVAVKRGLEMEPSVNWMVGDARRLDENFGEGTFGAIVDKGTVDAIYLSAGDSCTEDVGAVAAGAARVLQPRGTFLCVSLSAPRYIWPLLRCDAWDTSQCEVRRLDGAFLYVMRRGRLKKK